MRLTVLTDYSLRMLIHLAVKPGGRATIAEVARAVGIGTVALSGGCFQNRFLLEGTHRRLLSTGFTVLRHRELPPNDGNIAAGQALAVRLGITEVEP